MKTETKKAGFSLVKTIILITQIDILRKLYQSKFNIDLKMIITQYKFNLINDTIKNFIYETYTDVILTNEKYYEEYSKIVISDELKKFDNKHRITVKRRITLSELKEKKKTEKLSENERLIMYSIQLKHLSTRLHNLGKHEKCNKEEARSIIAGIQIVFKKSLPILEKYGRRGEFKLEE